jgi:hypothetical protein
MKIGALTVLAFLFVGVASLDPVRLAVIDNHYTTLIVGTPGTRVKFRVNITHNDINIHKSLDSLSQTFYRSSDGVSGSESFFIGPHRVRMNVKFSVLESDRMFSILQQPHEGVLGLGPMSPIWLHWKYATITPRKIYLNEFKHNSMMNPHENCPVFSYDDIWIFGTEGVRINPSSMITLLPRDVFNSSKKKFKLRGKKELCKFVFKQGKCLAEKEFVLSGKNLMSSHGIKFESVVSAPIDQIWLGSEFFDDHVIFIDREARVVSFSESVYAFQQYSYESWFAVILALISIVYVLIEMEHSTQIRSLEIYGVFTAFIAFISQIFGLYVARHIRDYCDMQPWPFLLIIGIFILATAIKMALTSRSDIRYIERLLFISASLTIIWLCRINQHTSLANQIFIAFLMTLLNIFSWFTLMDGYARNLTLWPVVIPITLSHSFFLFFGALLPAYASTHVSSWMIFDAYIYYLMFILTPAWVMQLTLKKNPITSGIPLMRFIPIEKSQQH